MPISDTSSYSTQGFSLQLDGKILPGLQSVPTLGAENATEIDVTTLQSKAVETAIGLPDGGSLGLTGVLNIQDPIFADLTAFQSTGNLVFVIAAVGGVPTSSNVTDGSPQDIIVSRPLSAAVEIGFNTITEAVPRSLPAVSTGDYVFVDDGAGGRTYTRITGITRTGSVKLILADTEGFENTPTTYGIVRPAWKLDFSARVAGLSYGAVVNEVWRYNLTLRVSGVLTRTIGTPDVSL